MAEGLGNNDTALLGEDIDNRRVASVPEINKRDSEEVTKLDFSKREKGAKLMSREVRDEKIKRNNETVEIHYVREQYCLSPRDFLVDKHRNVRVGGDRNMIGVFSYVYEFVTNRWTIWTTLGIAVALISAVIFQLIPPKLGALQDNKEKTYGETDLMDFMTAVWFPEQKLNVCLMGLKSGSIPGSSMTASSEANENHGPRLGRLDLKPISGYSMAWCAKSNNIGEWIQVDFGQPSSAAGVVTQGRGDADQWVKSFKVSYGNLTNQMKTVMKEGHDLVFAANEDRNSKVINLFPNTITCRYIRVHPQNWYGHISMRLDFLKAECRQWF